MRRRPEKDLDARVTDALRGLGFHVSRFEQPRATKQTRGTPDLYIMHPAWRIACWLELKSRRGALSPAQHAWHLVAERAGVPVFVIRSTADLVDALRQLGMPIQ